MAAKIPQLPSAIPLPIQKEVLLELVEKAKDWALMHGAAMRSKSNFSADSLNFAPFILTPSAYPRKEFEKAQKLQPLLNELTHKVAFDFDFLTECLKDTVQVDEFTNKLYQILLKVKKTGLTQPVSLGILRSDYMVHSNDSKIKQVEINTVASSFGGIGTKISTFNRFVLQELGYHDRLQNLPENHALEGICSAMLEAHKVYGKASAVILFIVEDVTFNICDQRFHEFEISRLAPNVKVKRRTLTQIAHGGRLGSNKEFLLDDDFEVAVVYFRAGYDPNHYHSSLEWDARLLIEDSLAIKCPSIQYHLAGTKKVQQELAKPGVLERFLKNPEDVEKVRSVFTGLYSLDFDDFGDLGVRLALENPERYVLKPQREGGGNNIYGKDITAALSKMKDSKERTAWILMERIHPPISRSYLISPGGPPVPEIVNLISELGIFGYILGDSKSILQNKQVGHMLRTKLSTANEGGVAAGVGALDSPYLID